MNKKQVKCFQVSKRIKRSTVIKAENLTCKIKLQLGSFLLSYLVVDILLALIMMNKTKPLCPYRILSFISELKQQKKKSQICIKPCLECITVQTQEVFLLVIKHIFITGDGQLKRKFRTIPFPSINRDGWACFLSTSLD